MMRFAERMVISILRPIYRGFFERPLWWFLDKVKSFFFAELSIQISQCLSKTEDIERRLRVIEERLERPFRGDAAQWDALEQLLLALYRQPEPPASDLEWKGTQWPNTTTISTGVELSRVNESNNIR